MEAAVAPKRRGRPPKPKEEPLTSAEERVATYLSRTCGIPGCFPAVHRNDARQIVEMVKQG
jgi:hypothetical protein